MNIVKYTHEQVWDAIYYVYPTYKTAMEAGVYMNPPMAVRDALLEYFMQRERGVALNSNHGDVLWTALNDLNTNGSFNYEIPSVESKS